MEVLDNIFGKSRVGEDRGNMLDYRGGLRRRFENDRVSSQKCRNEGVD